MTFTDFNATSLLPQTIDICTECSGLISGSPMWTAGQGYCSSCAGKMAARGYHMSPSRLQDMFITAANDVFPDLCVWDWLEEEYGITLSGRRYRADFIIKLAPRVKIFIEIDSFRHHSSSEDLTRDRVRQRKWQLDGWYPVRFSGSEIWHDPAGCVQELIAIVIRHLIDLKVIKAVLPWTTSMTET